MDGDSRYKAQAIQRALQAMHVDRRASSKDYLPNTPIVNSLRPRRIPDLPVELQLRILKEPIAEAFDELITMSEKDTCEYEDGDSDDFDNDCGCGCLYSCFGPAQRPINGHSGSLRCHMCRKERQNIVKDKMRGLAALPESWQRSIRAIMVEQHDEVLKKRAAALRVLHECEDRVPRHLNRTLEEHCSTPHRSDDDDYLLISLWLMEESIPDREMRYGIWSATAGVVRGSMKKILGMSLEGLQPYNPPQLPDVLEPRPAEFRGRRPF